MRPLLFQCHLWTGLILGFFLTVLGLSGSLLVYDDATGDFLNPPPRAIANGQVLPLQKIAAIARDAAGPGQMQIMLPEKSGQAVTVLVGQISRMGQMPGMPATDPARRRPMGAEQLPPGLQLYIDPVSGAVLGSRQAMLPPLLIFAHQLHGNFLMGSPGRMVVGWLGVAMLLLGLTGIVLWWPRRGQWKQAFIVRRNAKGLRFHRELHGAAGIWFFLLFMLVAFSGVVIAFPNARALTGHAAPRVTRHIPAPAPDAPRTDIDRALDLAQKALPNAVPASITIPAAADLPLGVGLLADGAVAATVSIDPWRPRVLGVNDPSDSFIAWQRPLHQGTGMGPVYRALIFLSGLLPALMMVTGFMMWLKKRRQRVSSAPAFATTGQ